MPFSFKSLFTWWMWYFLPCLVWMRSRTADARVPPPTSILRRVQPGSWRGPLGGRFGGRQHLHLHLHLHAFFGPHAHALGLAHRPLHLHGLGGACRCLPLPSPESSARQAAHVESSPPPPPPFPAVDSIASLIAAATSSLETSLFRPWPPRARSPSAPSAR